MSMVFTPLDHEYEYEYEKKFQFNILSIYNECMGVFWLTKKKSSSFTTKI